MCHPPTKYQLTQMCVWCTWLCLALLHHFRWVKGNSEVAWLVHHWPSWAELRAVSPDLAVNSGASLSDEPDQLSLSVRRASVWWKWFIWSSDTGWRMLAGKETGVNPTIWRVGTRLHREQQGRERETESKSASVKDIGLVLKPELHSCASTLQDAEEWLN